MSIRTERRHRELVVATLRNIGASANDWVRGKRQIGEGIDPDWPRIAEAFAQLETEVKTESARRIAELEERVRGLESLIDRPLTAHFLEAVRIEAAHQVERWKTATDAGKTHADWFWLVGYLAGKALTSAAGGNKEKALHHTISTAAALCNWHHHLQTGSTEMRPGIEPPA